MSKSDKKNLGGRQRGTVPRKCIEPPDGERLTPYYTTLSEETGLQAKSLQGMRRHLPTLVRAGDQFDLAEKAAQREAAQRGAVQKNVAQRKADREKQINDALDVLAPPPDERERCRAHIEEVLDLMASADRASEHAVTKKALSDYRGVLVRFRAGSKRSADAHVPLGFRLDAIDHAIKWLDHWSPPPSALKQRHAVALAYELATSWSMETLVSPKGKWHQLAQILCGDRDASLYRQVQTFAKRRQVRSRRTKVRSRRKP